MNTCKSKNCRRKTDEKLCVKHKREEFIMHQYVKGEITNAEIYRFWQEVDKFSKLK